MPDGLFQYVLALLLQNAKKQWNIAEYFHEMDDKVKPSH